MNKKIILFVIHELASGGAQRVIVNLANNLDKEKFDIHLCLFKKKGSLLEELTNDIKIHDLGASRVITAVFSFLSLIINLRPNIVFTSITHVNLLLSIFIPFLKLFLKNTLFISREVNIPSIRAKHKKKSKKLDFFYRKFIHNYDYIIAQSYVMRDDIAYSYGLDSAKIKVVNNPLDIKKIHMKIAETNETHLFNTAKTNILAIGRLHNQKGFDRLLETIPLLDDRFHLYIIGEGEERTALEEQIDRSKIKDRVTLLGFQSNPYKYMKQASMVVLSSRYEGFPNVILEANACGKFVIAFACPGVSDEIIQNNINGILVECGNIRSLAESIEKYSSKIHDEKMIIDTTHKYEVGNTIQKYENIFLNGMDRQQ